MDSHSSIVSGENRYSTAFSALRVTKAGRNAAAGLSRRVSALSGHIFVGFAGRPGGLESPQMLARVHKSRKRLTKNSCKIKCK